MNRPPLKLIAPSPEQPARQTVDIYAGWKAEIAAIDWAATHIAGDRRLPVDVADTRKGWWR